MAHRISKTLLVGGVLLGLLVSLPAFAGSAVVGSVAGNINATLSGEPILPNSTILSGDSLQVNNGLAIVALSNGGRVTFGRQTKASFLQDADATTVLLSGGNANLYHPADSGALVIRAGDVSVSPAAGFLTAGVVAMAGGYVIVTSQEGTLRVKANGRQIEVGKGKSITLGAKSAQPAGSPQFTIGGATYSWAQLATIFTSAAGAVLGGVTISKADAANSNATAALSNAATAASEAAAATAGANAATIATDAVGCAIDVLANEENVASPWTVPMGVHCP